jgi:hypothetical protein
MKIGEKVRAVRDFSVERFFDQGWEVKKGVIEFVYAIDLDSGEIAIDFGEVLDSRKRKGRVVLVVRQNDN